MGGSLSEGLRVVFAIVLSCLVIGFVFMVWNSVKASGNTALTDSNNVITTMDEAKYMQYDGARITGSEVINVLQQFKNDPICIVVYNGAAETSYNYTSDALDEPSTADVKYTRDKTATNQYILPNRMFDGTVTRAESGNGAITKITFTAEGEGGSGGPTDPTVPTDPTDPT